MAKTSAKKLRNLRGLRGKPINEKLFLEGYKELLQIYKEIREALTGGIKAN